jgi:hypothetical protein
MVDVLWMDVLCGDDAYADICRFHATSGYLESTVDVTPGNNLAWPCVQLQWISGTWSM